MNEFKETQPLNLDELGRHTPMVPHAPIMKLIPNPSTLPPVITHWAGNGQYPDIDFQSIFLIFYFQPQEISLNFLISASV